MTSLCSEEALLVSKIETYFIVCREKKLYLISLCSGTAVRRSEIEKTKNNGIHVDATFCQFRHLTFSKYIAVWLFLVEGRIFAHSQYVASHGVCIMSTYYATVN